MSRLEHPDEDIPHRIVPLHPKDADGPVTLWQERHAEEDTTTAPPMVRSPLPEDTGGTSPVLPCVLLGGFFGACSTGVALGTGVPVWLGLLLWPAVGLAVAFVAILAVLICSRPSVPDMKVTFSDGEEKPVGKDWLDGAIARPLGVRKPPGTMSDDSRAEGQVDPCRCDD